ncbi:hypothetical protein [Desulfurococcus sp.]|uniref:hypothetical protein n=1 Tax=Desulfurococcus sp. TaxID=51678 RepID=UPI003167BE5A
MESRNLHIFISGFSMCTWLHQLVGNATGHNPIHIYVNNKRGLDTAFSLVTSSRDT